MSFVTFIIPTIGRDTLGRTLDSLVNQTDPDWTAIVVADNVPGLILPIQDKRISLLPLREKMGFGHMSGFVRNAGIALTVSKWCGFVDDDDRLDHQYVEWLSQEGPGSHLLVFRMIYSSTNGSENRGEVWPKSNQLGPGMVGISFAVQNQFRDTHDLWFDPSEFEDWHFIKACLDAGASIKVSSRIAYYIRH
jgi:glycosyltransferase involved in cell wall biosynthesis